MDPTEKLKSEIETWRKGYEKLQSQHQRLELEHRQMGAELVKQSTELVETKDKLQAAAELLRDEINAKNEAVRLLETISTHVAGKTGMLGKSNRFCAVCENPLTCPISQVFEFIGKAKEAA